MDRTTAHRPQSFLRPPAISQSGPNQRTALKGEALPGYQDASCKNRLQPHNDPSLVSTIRHFQLTTRAGSPDDLEKILRHHQGQRPPPLFAAGNSSRPSSSANSARPQASVKPGKDSQPARANGSISGSPKLPQHSTLTYANQHRPFEIDQDHVLALPSHLRAKLPLPPSPRSPANSIV